MEDNKLKEAIKKEYTECAKDPVYFLKKYAMIQHPIEGKIPFGLYDFQEKTLNDLYDKIWQAGVVLLNTKSVGVMGDERTYDYVVALRAICSNEGMTANIYPFDMRFLEDVSNRIINSVEGINRVVYDISSKPPATIEWE